MYISMVLFSILLFLSFRHPAGAAVNAEGPSQTTRLIFIHHSTGENWLSDENGGLGLALRDNNYFVSDTNYGWGPAAIGDTTDIGHWWLWFRGPDSQPVKDALYAEGSANSSYSRQESSQAGENEIVMFKSCFPNSALSGNVVDEVPPIEDNPLRGQDAWSEFHTVANAKGIYIDLLDYFRTRQDKLFVAITAPPLSDPSYASNARAFNEWLVKNWLADYPYRNVAVFDFYNVLTTNGGNRNTNDLGRLTGNHHRILDNTVQHKSDAGANTSAYPSASDDDHPSQAGNLKATGEFLPVLNAYFNCWKGTGGCPDTPPVRVCDATLATDLTVTLPVVQFENTFLLAELVYDLPTSLFRVTKAGFITNPKDYSGCRRAVLSPDASTLKLSIPAVTFSGVSYWADLEWVRTDDGQVWFRAAQGGQNN